MEWMRNIFSSNVLRKLFVIRGDMLCFDEGFLTVHPYSEVAYWQEFRAWFSLPLHAWTNCCEYHVFLREN